MSRVLVARVVVVFSVLSSLACNRAEGGTVFLTWDPNPDPTVAGYTVHYGLESHNYTTLRDAGDQLGLTLAGLHWGATYYFAVSAYNTDGYECSNSTEVSITMPLPPIILLQPSSQIAQASGTAEMYVDVLGTPPISFQWYNGTTPIPGGTNSLLTLREVSQANAGVYLVVISDAIGTISSDSATVTVLDPPGDLGSQSNIAGSKMQDAIAASGLVASIASAAGTYNGLFYQTNDNGMPAVDLLTAGMLSNCVVDAQGDYSGTLCIPGFSYPLSGVFTASGDGTATVDRSADGFSNLAVTLHVDLTGGAMPMTGAISNMDGNAPWCAALTAEMQTNGFARPANFYLLIPPYPTGSYGGITGTEANGYVSLAGVLGDGTLFWQNAPISANGTMPVYVPLYGQLGLLTGWVNAFSDPSTALLTWICPASASGPGFADAFEVSVRPTDDSGPEPNESFRPRVTDEPASRRDLSPASDPRPELSRPELKSRQ